MKQPTEEQKYLMDLWETAYRKDREAWFLLEPVWNERDRVRKQWWRPLKEARVTARWQVLFNKYMLAREGLKRVEERCFGAGLYPPNTVLATGWRDRHMGKLQGPDPEAIDRAVKRSLPTAP